MVIKQDAEIVQTQNNHITLNETLVSDNAIISLSSESEMSSVVSSFLINNFKVIDNFSNYILFESDDDQYVFVKKNNQFYKKDSGDILDDDQVKQLFGNNYNSLLKCVRNPADSSLIEDKIIDSLFSIDNILEDYPGLTDEEKFKKALTDYSCNHIIIGAPGTGKTSGSLKILSENKTPFIFVAPTKALVKQIINKYQVYDLNEVRTDSNHFAVGELLEMRRPIVTYYDGFEKISSIILQKWDYVLVLDEIHMLVLQSNFRGSKIKSLFSNAYKFKKIVGLTATPYGCLSRVNDFRLIRIGSKATLGHVQYNIISHSADKNNQKNYLAFILGSIIRLINNNSGKFIVFINNIKIIDRVRYGLLLSGIFNEEEIVQIESRLTDLEIVGNILKSENTGEKVKIILTTSVITNGINLLDNDYEGILIFDINNLIDVFQLIFRAREVFSELVVYDFISSSGEESKDYPYHLLLESITENVRQIQQSVNILRKIINTNSKSAEFAFDNDNKIVSLLRSKNDFQINTEQIHNYSINSLFSYSVAHPEFRKRILHKMGINASLQTQSEIVENPINSDKIKSLQENEKLKNLNSFIGQIKNKKSQLLSYCIKNNLVSGKLQNLLASGQPPLKHGYYFLNKNLLNDARLKTWLNDYILYHYVNKIPHNESALLINADTNTDFDLKYYLTFIRNTYGKSSGYDRDVEFSQRIDKYFLSKNDRILSVSELKEVVSKFSSDSDLISFFSTKPQKKLSHIYNFRPIKRTGNAKTKYLISYLSFEKKVIYLLKQLGIYDKFGERAISRFKQYLKSGDMS